MKLLALLPVLYAVTAHPASHDKSVLPDYPKGVIEAVNGPPAFRGLGHACWHVRGGRDVFEEIEFGKPKERFGCAIRRDYSKDFSLDRQCARAQEPRINEDALDSSNLEARGTPFQYQWDLYIINCPIHSSTTSSSNTGVPPWSLSPQVSHKHQVSERSPPPSPSHTSFPTSSSNTGVPPWSPPSELNHHMHSLFAPSPPPALTSTQDHPATTVQPSPSPPPAFRHPVSDKLLIGTLSLDETHTQAQDQASASSPLSKSPDSRVDLDREDFRGAEPTTAPPSYPTDRSVSIL